MAAEMYPRILNGEGCLFGQHLKGEVAAIRESQKERMDRVEKKLDRLTWTAAVLALSLLTASLTAWITYLGP